MERSEEFSQAEYLMESLKVAHEAGVEMEVLDSFLSSLDLPTEEFLDAVEYAMTEWGIG